jgi:7-carboxy-7-deazaguanine synthase
MPNSGPTRQLPVAEIFGPTIQGEGIDQGVPCHFIRLGGCDFRCTWCDTPHAVIPAEVRELPRLSPSQIVERVDRIPGGAEWVILTGGNPALFDLSALQDRLHMHGYKTSVETQGSRWQEWFYGSDLVCLSPKPPSSLMECGLNTLDTIVRRLDPKKVFLKVVVFTPPDLDFAAMIHQRYPRVPFFLSAGNDAGRTVGNPTRREERTLDQVRTGLIEQFSWLTERVLERPEFSDVRVQSQQHVLLWGNEKGH